MRDSKRKKGAHAGKNSGGVLIRTLVMLLCIAAALSVGAYACTKAAVKPPDVVRPPKTDVQPINSEPKGDEPDPIVVPGNRQETEEKAGEKYTFVLLGMDDGNGNSDTILTGTFDSGAHKLHMVSIPRDTLVNVTWSTKKVNTLYSHGGADGLKSGLKDLLGYEVDFYVIVDMKAFVKLIDGIGGVTFDVPVDMNYDDPAQNLSIHFKKGVQTLSGQQSLEVVRFRKGYKTGDIGRIATQQAFLKAAFGQILKNAANIPITTLADIVINDVKTDLDYGNILWFAGELLKLNAEDVTFATMPGNYDDYVYVNGRAISYVTIKVGDWLKLINSELNPTDNEIREKDLDILTRDKNGTLYATSGKIKAGAGWGSKT